jgi:transcriptional regulator with XRE-family HTH domain
MVGKSQSYIAKVERGIGTKNVSFDMLFSLLAALGYKCKITTNKVSEPETIAA